MIILTQLILNKKLNDGVAYIINMYASINGSQEDKKKANLHLIY